jgi:hypothetical protein
MVATETFLSVVDIEWDRAHQGWWAAEGGAVRATLAEHYGADVSGAQLTPSADPDGLRAQLRRAAPRLAEFCNRVRCSFDQDKACAVLVPRLGLAGLDVDTQRQGVFALAALIGYPTANLPFEQAFWDVQDHGAASSRHTSFSENDREADYHADNGALRVPERFFLLYSVQAARCGGGVSLIRDGRILKRQLEEIPGGPEAIQVLSSAVIPRRVPKAFWQYADVAPDGYRYTPILTESRPPMWRWRKDRVFNGLAKHPEYDTPDVRRAVDLLSEVLATGADQLRQVVPTDGLIIVNNHIALHGRTAFTDSARHMLRLRFHEPSASRT